MSIRTYLIAAAATLALTGCASPAPIQIAESGGATIRDIRIATVAEVERPEFYEAIGTVRARYNATLASKVMARVSGVEVREGNSVLKGTTLVTLDGRELAAGVQVAAANLSASAVGVDNARTALKSACCTTWGAGRTSL
jgi:multidrug efflux pump subunit AcrA (membrane-fusion protein)